MSFSFGHMIVLLVVVFVIFGAGKLPQVMGDVAKGLKAFKDGLKEGEKDDEKNGERDTSIESKNKAPSATSLPQTPRASQIPPSSDSNSQDRT